MNVDDRTAFALLKAFSRMEFALKKVPHFVKGDVDRAAQVQWGNVSLALTQLPLNRFLEAVPDAAKAKMFRDRNRPMKQLVVMDGPAKTATFRSVPLPGNDSAALLEAAQRVRNNLFHGGKEDPDDQHYSGEDQEWAEAALAIVECLLPLVGRELNGPD